MVGRNLGTSVLSCAPQQEPCRGGRHARPAARTFRAAVNLGRLESRRSRELRHLGRMVPPSLWFSIRCRDMGGRSLGRVRRCSISGKSRHCWEHHADPSRKTRSVGHPLNQSIDEVKGWATAVLRRRKGPALENPGVPNRPVDFHSKVLQHCPLHARAAGTKPYSQRTKTSPQ